MNRSRFSHLRNESSRNGKNDPTDSTQHSAQLPPAATAAIKKKYALCLSIQANTRVTVSTNNSIFCGVVVNGVRLGQPYCHTVEDCVRQILEDYKNKVRRRSEPPPPPDPAEGLLREWPELGAFGVDWVRKWAILKERLVEIAKMLRRFP